MRFTVTPLGSAGGRPVAAVVRDIAEYLLGPAPDGNVPEPGLAERSEEGPVRYYADAGEGPGRWLGHGADELGLVGAVGAGEFRTVLAGRDPRSGERLISARGSAGRVRDLGSGSATRWSPVGEALYVASDAAAALGWSRHDVDDAIAEGEQLAARRLFSELAATAGAGDEDRDDPGMVLVPLVARDESRVIPDRELSRVEALVTASRSGEAVLAGGDPGELLSVPAAARAVGTSRSYLARLCRSYTDHQGEIEVALAAGERPKRVYIVCDRNEAGEWRIARNDLAAFAHRRRQPAVRVGYDITATTEKSFSALALLGGAEVRREVLAGVEAANDRGIRWLERHAASARSGGKQVGVTGWTVASFRHLTSRRLDPFVHHHNVVANTVTDETGQRHALDARPLFHSAKAASALATAQARFELTARLGVAFRPGRRGGWEIAGISDAVLGEFSQRTREIQETVRELEDALGRASTVDELQAVVASTRPAKQTGIDEAAVVARWWDRAQAHGLSPEVLEGCLGRARPSRLGRRQRAAVLAALGMSVTTERSVFARADVLAALVDLEDPAGGGGPLIVPAAELERLADDFLAGARVVALATSSGRHDLLVRQDGTTVTVGGDREVEYTTAEILAIQARTLETYGHRHGGGFAMVDDDLVDATLARFPELDDDQRRLVEDFCGSGDGAQSAIGRPGTGKTHAMRAAVRAWQAAGYRVAGTAVKAEAARHLGTECGIRAEPLAWYLNRFGDPAASPLDARTILVVDEASTVGDRDLHALLSAAARDGAAVRFIGDPAQHGSIAAGGLWRVITERFAHRTPQLTVGRRVRHEADARAAEALRGGRVADALVVLEDAGHLHIVESERELYGALLARWWHGRRDGHPHPMVDRGNDQRLVLNRLARQVRHQMGQLGEIEIRAGGDRRFAAGDEVIARMGDRALHPDGRPNAYVRNGAHGTVLEVEPEDDPAGDRVIVDFDGLGVIVLPRAFFDEHTDAWGRHDVGLDHAYAVTSYAVEGLTYDQSTSHVDPHSTRPEVYVDITRGRDANHVYLTAPEDPLAGERLPVAPGDSDRRQFEQRLTHSLPEPAALDLDPLAGPAALHAAGKTLAQLARERLDPTATPSVRALAAHAEAIRAHQVAHRASVHLDRQILTGLGPRPSEVYLADRYDRLIADMALYRARWEPRPGRAGPWAWALGEPPGHPAAVADRDRLVGELERFAHDVVARRLPPGGGGMSEGAWNAVRHLVAAGRFGATDLDHLAFVIAESEPGDDPALVTTAILAQPAPTGPGSTPAEDLGVA